MKGRESIREYYHPIQPSVKVGQETVWYKETEPDDRLKNHIHCYWQLSTQKILKTPYTYRVVSDGCIDVFFNLNSLSESFVMGFCKKYTEFPIGTEFNYAGIRFYPSAFPVIFEISAKSLRDKDRPLKPILPGFADFLSKAFNMDFDKCIPKLDAFFNSIIQRKSLKVDDRFNDALLHIYEQNGHLETESELNFGLSPRHLRRLFNYYIGTTPKSFCQVVRFQYILKAKPSTQSLKENKLYYDVGFCDQAHFIKNFTKFYGVTPAKAFR